MRRVRREGSSRNCIRHPRCEESLPDARRNKTGYKQALIAPTTVAWRRDGGADLRPWRRAGMSGAS